MTQVDFAALVAAVLRRRFGVPADVPWPDGEESAVAIGLGIAAVRESDAHHRRVGEACGRCVSECVCGKFVLQDFYASGEVHDFAEHRGAAAARGFVEASRG